MFDIDQIEAALLPVDAALSLTAHGREAAVLVPMRRTSGDVVSLVFTRRPEHMPRHAGEISFPGGRPEPSDDGLLDTALRETHEELGIPPDAVRVLGGLPPISTFVTDFAVHPVVGEVPASLPLTPHPGEVDEVLEYGLDELARVRTTQNWEAGAQRFDTDIFELDGNVIWGATARILGSLLERIVPAAAG